MAAELAAQCLDDDDVVELMRGRALGELSGVEAHLADCAACSALVAALIAGEADEHAADRWGALVGTTLGPYKLEAQIGVGAAGAVYRGWDQRLRRRVAVKVLLEDGAHARWVDTEARAAAAIAHVNVVTIHDVGRDNGHAYVVSELVEGESLRSVLAAGALPAARVRRLGLDLARGLAAAHAAGVIHRDLKPENVIAARDGTLKILDFGLAKLIDPGGGLDATIPGTLLGTVGYMAPEQARGEPVDARADLFAAGAILYEAATGRRAFDGATHADRLGAVLRDAPLVDDLGPLAPIVARCLAKSPADRFQSAADLLWSLDRLALQESPPLAPSPVEGPRTPSRRTLLLAGGAAALTGTLGFLSGRLTRPAPRAPAAPPTPRQLTFRQGRILTARFAHGGADIYYGAVWDNEPLTAHAMRLDGGVARALPLPSADVLAVSSTQLALALDRKNVDGQSATGRLALAPIDGGVPRELAAEVQEADFTPDGRDLAIVTRSGPDFRLELPPGNVLLDDPRWITHPRVSPDGRHVACLLHPHANDDQGALALVDRTTRALRILSDGWSSIAGLAWDPRGDRLWVTCASGLATNALRSITLDGRVHDSFSTIGRLRLHDATTSHFLLSRDVWRLRTMTTTVAATSPAVANPEQHLDRSLTPFSMVTDITSDGRSLIVAEFGDVDDVNGVYLVPTDGGARLRLGPGWPRALSPDGTRVLVTDFERVDSGRLGAALYAISGGGRTPVDLAPLTRIASATWLDDTTLVLEGAAADRPPRLWRLDLERAACSPLTDERIHGRLISDPTTERAAFIDPTGSLHTLSPPSTVLTTLATDLRDHVACGFLGPDVLVRTTTSPIAISRISSDGTHPHLTLNPHPLGLKGVDAVVLSRDTTHLAYSYGQELSELFLLDRAS